MCYQKCLNFAVLKVLPSGDWWVLSAISCWYRIMIVWRCTRSICYDAVVRLWLMLFFEVAYCLSQQLGVWSLDAVNFCWWISVLVFSSDSLIVGSRPSCREGVPFVEVHQILFLKWISLQCWVFWDEACQMVNLQWLEPFDACQWLVVSDRCLIVYLFCWDPSAFRFLRWISLLGNVLFLAICHWHWYHSLFVTIVRFLGSLMAQGSVWVGASAVEFLKQHLVFVTMS